MARYLRATYTTTVQFEIPKGIEADQFNTDVKWNTLFITQDDGEVLEIEAENEPNTDWKHPDKTVLLDEDFNPIEEKKEEESEDEEEEHDWNCSACEDFFDAGKEQCKKCYFDFSLFNKEEEESEEKEEYDWERSKTSFNYLFAGRIDKRIEEILGQ